MVSEKTEKKIRIIQPAAKFFNEFKAELKKIVWPDVKSVFKNTGIVLTSIIICGIFVGLLDLGLARLLGSIMNIAS